MKADKALQARRVGAAVESLENRLLLSVQILANPGFESGLSDWTPGNFSASNSISAASDQARSGTHSLKLTAASSDSNMYINSGWFAVAPDGAIDADLWLRSSIASGTLKVTVNVYDSAKTTQKTYINLVSTGSSYGGWTHYQRASFVVAGYSPSLLPSGSAWAQYRISFTGSTGTVWIDDAAANYQALPAPNPSGLMGPTVLPDPWLMNRADRSFTLGSMAIVYNSAESNLYSATNSWAGTLGISTAFFTNPADPNLNNYAFKLRYGSGSDSDIDAAFQQRFPGHTWAELGNEGYFLSVQNTGGQTVVYAGANSQQGRFYALQTLRQLIKSGKLYMADVLDKPTMEQRGIVMSASRYNQPDTLDRMAAYKMNTSWSQGSFMNGKFKESWKTTFTSSELTQLSGFISKANANYITPWMSFGPRGSGTGTRPHTNEPVYSSDTDIDTIVNKMDQLFGIGARNFGLNFDDIQNYGETTLLGADATRWGTNGYAYAHGYFLSQIKQRLQARHPSTPIQFATVAYDYWFPASHGGGYLTPFAQNIPQDVIISTCSYTDADILAMQSLTGRRTLVWHNYYAEGYHMTNTTYGAPFVGVYSWDDPAIRAEMSGLIGLMPQIGETPEDTARTSWMTTASYQWAPDRYDPDRSFQLAAAQYTGLIGQGGTATAPAAPTNLAATTLSSTQVRLDWTDSSDRENLFKIERRIGTGPWTQIGTAEANVGTYTDGGFSSTASYAYRVRASNAIGDSAYSNEVTAGLPSPFPAPPSSLHAAAVFADRIDLAWTDNADNETAFWIERKTEPTGVWGQIDTVAADVNSYSDVSLPAGQYSYRLRAANDAGTSDYSNVLTIGTLAPPAAPSDLAATVLSSTQVRLIWTDSDDNESGFKIERQDDGGAWVQIDTVAADVTTYTDSTVSPSIAYSYRLRATNAVGDSAYCAPASVYINPNVVNNPGFENALNATTDWETFATGGGTVSRVTNELHSGAYSFHSLSSNTTGNTGAYTNWFSAAAGSLVTFTAWIKYTGVTGVGPNGSTPSGIRMTLDAYQSNKTTRVSWWNFVDFAIGSTSGWIQATGSAIMPTNTVYARGRFQVDHCPGTLWVDDAQITVTTIPLAPGHVQAGDGSDANRVRLNWSESGGATGYEVWRGTSNNSASATKITAVDVTDTAYDDVSAVPGTTYWYWVKARNAAGTSPFSASDSGYRMIVKEWVGPATGGDWSNAANWSPSGAPGPSDVVAITASAITLPGSTTVSSLSLAGGAVLTLAPGSGSVLRTSVLSIDGGSKLDLNDNDFILDYTSATPLVSIRTYLLNGRNGGSWTGTGGIASTAAASDSARALGFAEATDIGSPSAFAGQTIDDTTVVVRFTINGDANLDRTVDISDLGVLATNWQQSGRRWTHGDFNYDQIIDISDLGILATNWQRILPPAKPASALPRSSPFRQPVSRSPNRASSLLDVVDQSGGNGAGIQRR